MKYYITDENGELQLVRTSTHEYKYFWLYKCSKSYEACVKEKAKKLKDLKEYIETMKKAVEDEEFRRKFFSKKCTKESLEEAIKEEEERLEIYRNTDIKELIAR